MISGETKGKWVELKPDVKVLRLWETEDGPGMHHIALLWLSDARYKEFSKDRIRFLTDYDIFYTKQQNKKLNEIVGEAEIAPPNDKNPGTERMVMVDHDWNFCNTLIEAMRLFEPPDETY